jgi:hypothetical protein
MPRKCTCEMVIRFMDFRMIQNRHGVRIVNLMMRSMSCIKNASVENLNQSLVFRDKLLNGVRNVNRKMRSMLSALYVPDTTAFHAPSEHMSEMEKLIVSRATRTSHGAYLERKTSTRSFASSKSTTLKSPNENTASITGASTRQSLTRSSTVSSSRRTSWCVSKSTKTRINRILAMRHEQILRAPSCFSRFRSITLRGFA